ncbi:MAG: hypothetical protein AUK47_25325 [Deltaproteobacteria bacterium CG2_30_63_29]|nr:MAG: hypothetical protein AUK47_25325 [Deltaproteobacteria bacterium CG2_30_63_29]PIW00928.1 MAG: hypothetical protein COW42_06430 [Deltaproteobacteria bacterium CG17_big_fil_post_rev_8_21_14_2_50_63_7]PJB40286.1 MAG: hypothetical protein CO108_15240 [Deltaproteobacteria bacterium CG_4_9_14_3_um_filter_63_12]
MTTSKAPLYKRFIELLLAALAAFTFVALFPFDASADPKVCARNCECGPDKVCDFVCPSGGCNIDCNGAKSCTVDCPGGTCNIDCNGAKSCKVGCGGGSCAVDCEEAGSCDLSCKNTCSLTCEGAKSCNSDCGPEKFCAVSR